MPPAQKASAPHCNLVWTDALTRAGVVRGASARAGTFPLQSERMYAALKGHGCKARLVVLPFESHGYRAYESIMHVLAEKERWLEEHCPPGARLDEGADTATVGGQQEAAEQPEAAGVA